MNELQWNFNQNFNIFIKENALKVSSAIFPPNCPGADVFILIELLLSIYKAGPQLEG